MNNKELSLWQKIKGAYFSLVPASKFKMIFPFQNKEYFSNKYITVLSFFFVALILWFAGSSFSKIGDVTNVIEFKSNFQNNSELS